MHMRTRTVGCDLGAAWDDSGEAILETPMLRNTDFHHEAMAMHMRMRKSRMRFGFRKGVALGSHFGDTYDAKRTFCKKGAPPPVHLRSLCY